MKKTLILSIVFLACATFRSGLEKRQHQALEARANELMDKAKTAFDSQEYKDAVRYLEEVIKKYAKSSYYDDALYIISVCEYRLENYQSALDYAAKLQREVPASTYYTKSFATLGEANYALANYYDAAQSFIKVQDLSKDDTERGKAFDKFMMTLTNLKINELEKLHRANFTNRLDEHILFYLGEREMKSGKIETGKRDLELLLRRFPASQYEGQIEELLATATLGKVTKTIGALIPLSGKFSQYGNDVKNLIDYFIVEGKFPLPVKYMDTRSEPVEALRGALRLVQDYRVDVIVGPIFSIETFGVCGMASGLKVPVVLPTISDPRFENLIPSVVQLNISAASETRAVSKYAVERLGLKKIAIFYPNEGIGEVLAQTFEEQVKNDGGEIVGRIAFRTDTTTFGKDIEMLKKTNPEAVFFPGDADQIVLIAPQFAYYGLEKLRLLGLRDFKEEKVARLGEKYVEGAVFATVQQTPDDEATKIVQGYTAGSNKKVGFTEKKFLEALIGLKRAMETSYTKQSLVDEIRRAFKKDTEVVKLYHIKDGAVVELPEDAMKKEE